MSVNLENKKISLSSFTLPSVVCLLIVFFHLANLDARSVFGLKPQNIDYLTGIFLVPFAHSDINHLLNNTIPLFFLISVLVHFFDNFSYKSFFNDIKSNYPEISEYDIINFFKHKVMRDMAEQYNYVCYMDFDDIPNTTEA